MPKVHGKVGERIAQERTAAEQEVADLYAEDSPQQESQTTSEGGGDEPAPSVTTVEAPPPPSAPPSQEPIAAVTEPPPGTPPPADPPFGEPPVSNQGQALKLERDHWRKKEQAWETEKRAIAERLALQEQELARIRERDQQYDELFKPEETPEEEEAKRFWGEVERRAEEKAKSFAQSAEQRATALELQFSAMQSQQAHPDFAQTTGWTGNPDGLLDPAHPFAQYLANSPVVLDQIFKAPNKGEALYLAARNFVLNQPGAMDQEIETRVQAKIREAEARIRAEAEAQYRTAIGKLASEDQRAPGSGSIMAMPAGGSTPRKDFNPDEYDPYAMSREKRQLFGQGFADIYAE